MKVLSAVYNGCLQPIKLLTSIRLTSSHFHRMTSRPLSLATGYTIDEHRVYDAEGKALPRYVLSGKDNSLINLDIYPLDDPSEPWTFIDDTEYEIDQERRVRCAENERAEYVWVLIGKKMWCVRLLREDILDRVRHKLLCVGGKSCCSSCGCLWKIYHQHTEKCWPCLLSAKIQTMTTTCPKKRSLCADPRCRSCFSRSFASSERSLFWSNANLLDSKLVSLNNHKSYEFDCPDCGHAFSSIPANITSRGHWCRYCSNKGRCDNDDCVHCFNHSFASHPKSKYWSEKNLVTARSVALSSGDKYWFDCPDCGHNIEMGLSTIVNGNWCRYCVNQDRCDSDDCVHCFNHSFASHPKSKYWSKKNLVTARSAALNGNHKYWFDCPDCGHDIEIGLNTIATGQWCRYCSNKGRCDNDDCVHCFNHSFASHPKSKYWSKKNLVTARSVALSGGDKYWFDCPDCKNTFNIRPSAIVQGYWCRYCINKTEAKIFTWLHTILPQEDVKDQARFDWCRNPATNYYLPFDFYLPTIRCILELDGKQHLIQVRNWNAPEYAQWFDAYKMSRAAEQGLTVIRILQEDVWRDRYDWKAAILQHLRIHETPTRILLDNNTGVYQQNGYDTRFIEAGALMPALEGETVSPDEEQKDSS